MLKYEVYTCWYLPANWTISNVVLHDLTLIFHGQTFQLAILTSKQSKNASITIANQIERQIFASEWCHCECCVSLPWPTFSSDEIWNVNIWKTMRVNPKYSGMPFIQVDICHRMGPLRMLYSVVLTYFFKVKYFKCKYLWNS